MPGERPDRRFRRSGSRSRDRRGDAKNCTARGISSALQDGEWIANLC
jgi:hypothetical protein